jgi:hypothetical protein
LKITAVRKSRPNQNQAARRGDSAAFNRTRCAALIYEGFVMPTLPQRSPTVHAESNGQPGTNRCRPRIVVSTEEHEVNAEAAEALARDPTIYQRGGLLVRIVRDASPAAKGVRRPFAPRIETLPPALLREKLAASASWVQIRETQNAVVESPVHPPGWCVSAVSARADWPSIRHLEAVVDYPILRPDGTILSRRGYDSETALLLDDKGALPPIPSRPTKDQVIVARDALLEVVADFPFERDSHRAAWLAGLLTPLARFAFKGPAPLFLVDSNVRGAGKGLLLDTISRIVTGERFVVATYTNDHDEMRKRITSLALAGDRFVLFDNLAGKFGDPVLDAALTGVTWKDRVLGVNRTMEAPLYMTWFATGNNVAIAADTTRRICHIRLDSPEERPEERKGFRHPNLLEWVGEHRTRLLVAGLTVLRGYFAAGCPDQRLPAWGSFEAWSAVVRGTVAWVGMPDPGETRLLLQQHSDVVAEGMGLFLQCLAKLDPERQGRTSAEIVQTLRDDPPNEHPELRDAVDTLVGRLDASALGNKLRAYRRRVFDGRYLDRAGTTHSAVRWASFPAEMFGRRVKHAPQSPHTPPSGEPGESGEAISPQAPVAAEDADRWEEF